MTHASIDGMIALNADQKIVAWNQTVASWSGCAAAEVIGKSFFEVFPQAFGFTGLQKALSNAMLGFKSFLEAKDGLCFPGYYEAHIVPLHSGGGQAVKGVLIILHDVAHRVKTEDQLKSLNQQLSRQNAALQQANEELAVFAKIAAHDLKEPLRKIYTFAELIMMREGAKLSKDGRANFRRIQKSVQRMGLLTDDIVNFSELSRNSAFEEVDMSALLGEELLFFKEDIARTEAVIECERLPALPGNLVALQQLLRQLLHNAFKFRASGHPPHIRIGCKTVWGTDVPLPGAEAHQQYCRIAVADNGIGFEMRYRTRIFELFQRLHPEGAFPGSGIGLAIAHKAVTLHRGFIDAESTPGQGSTFYCYLPLHQNTP